MPQRDSQRHSAAPRAHRISRQGRGGSRQFRAVMAHGTPDSGNGLEPHQGVLGLHGEDGRQARAWPRSTCVANRLDRSLGSRAAETRELTAATWWQANTLVCDACRQRQPRSGCSTPSRGSDSGRSPRAPHERALLPGRQLLTARSWATSPSSSGVRSLASATRQASASASSGRTSPSALAAAAMAGPRAGRVMGSLQPAGRRARAASACRAAEAGGDAAEGVALACRPFCCRQSARHASAGSRPLALPSMAAAPLSRDAGSKANASLAFTPLKPVVKPARAGAKPSGSPAVQVAVRIRPLLPAEREAGMASVFTTSG